MPITKSLLCSGREGVLESVAEVGMIPGVDVWG